MTILYLALWLFLTLLGALIACAGWMLMMPGRALIWLAVRVIGIGGRFEEH